MRGAIASIQIGPVATGVVSDPPSVSIPRSVTKDVGILDATPNPFNPHVLVRFANRVSGRLAATILDVRARRVRRICDRHFQPGVHELDWIGDSDDGGLVASGVCFVRISGLGGADVRKVALIK